MLNTSLEGTESTNSGDFTGSANDFRKITLIKNSQNASGSDDFKDATLRGTYAVRINSYNNRYIYCFDEEINQASTGVVGKVVEWDVLNRILYYVQTRHNDVQLFQRKWKCNCIFWH